MKENNGYIELEQNDFTDDKDTDDSKEDQWSMDLLGLDTLPSEDDFRLEIGEFDLGLDDFSLGF